MAERDFGQVETTYFEQRKQTSDSNKTLLITVLATIFAIVCFAVGFFMGEKHGVESAQGNKHEELVTKLQNQQQELESLKEDAQKWQTQEANTSQVGELTFYNELPDQAIMPEPINGKPLAKDNTAFLDKLEAQLIKDKNKEHATQKTEQKLEDVIKAQLKTTSRSFRIQIASFKEQQDALSFLPKVEALSIPAEIQRVNLSNLGTYYRVYTKTYNKEQDAMQAKALIKQKLYMTGILIQND